MPDLEAYVGQVLDEKYRLEQLLGQGGMGAVYLATHLGTERYVALKLIAPQYMRNEEFVERFKREARAAGRLRHPNVVDVTDFGFARVAGGQVAYLVMEYLDGCTLGDVLAEEKRLPLEWVVDILEQVCSAVYDAHQQGIVHRDLKPDNIWLEPNRLGSYRVKVLDFGIAKLADPSAPPVDDDALANTLIGLPPELIAEGQLSQVSVPSAAADSESATLLQPNGEEVRTPQIHVNDGGEKVAAPVHAMNLTGNFNRDEAVDTKLFDAKIEHPRVARPTEKIDLRDRNIGEDDGTLLFNQSTRAFGAQSAQAATGSHSAALTRVGAIMGTPLYMSPEQCAGGTLDARADIYSLGVIAYQMLSGEPPFTGNTSAVIRAHREQSPKDLRDHEAKIPKRVAGVVMSALSKDPAARPQTAFAFASSLRGQAEGIGALYRRAFSLYSEYFPKFLKLSLIAHLPVIVTTILLTGLFIADKFIPKGGLAQKIAMMCAMGVVGLLQIAAFFVAAATISGCTAIIVTQLTVAPLRPVELRAVFAVMRDRWKPFLKTAFWVTLRILIGYVLLVIPGIVITIRYALYAPVVLIEGLEKKAAMRRARELASRSWRTIIIVSILQILIPMIVSIFVGRIRLGSAESLRQSPLAHQVSQQLLGLVQIFVIPLMSIVPALLYLKMRQLGGESLSAAMAQLEGNDAARSQWQQRMRTRLSLHTPTSAKVSGHSASTPSSS